MADPVYQRPLDAPAQVAVARAVKWLGQHGYQVGAQSDLEASLTHAGGIAPSPPRHGLKVWADGHTISVAYVRASLFDAEPSTAELARIERLVDQMVAASRSGVVLSYQEWEEEQPDLRAPPTSGKAPAFCPECGTRAEAGAATCTMCGAKL